MMGEGRYEWIGLDGAHRTGTHWDDLPTEMLELIAFVPDYPEPPHSEEDHEAMATFHGRLSEALSRCKGGADASSH